MEKCCRVRRATEDNTAHALCILITKATDTHSEYVIIIAFKWQLQLRESTLVLRYANSVCFIITVNDVLEQNVFGHTSRKCESANRTNHQ